MDNILLISVLRFYNYNEYVVGLHKGKSQHVGYAHNKGLSSSIKVSSNTVTRHASVELSINTEIRTGLFRWGRTVRVH